MPAKEWFNRAQQEGFAIGAFNVDNLEIMNAICLAGRAKKSPIMLEFSQGEVGYFGLENIVDLVANAREKYKIPILLNLDHAKEVEDCEAAINYSSDSHSGEQSDSRIDSGQARLAAKRVRMTSDFGFDDIHFDGSELAFEENVESTKRVVEAAHAKGILVEGEIDKLSGSSEAHQEEVDLEVLKKSYTDPLRAKKFVEATGVDIFAAVFGNVHGTFPNQPDLDFELLKKIRQALPNTFLSLHGGSGIAADQVKEAISVAKIVKVNVNTELRQAFKDALAQKMSEDSISYAYYKMAPDIESAVAAVVEGKIEVFGSGGKI